VVEPPPHPVHRVVHLNAFFYFANSVTGLVGAVLLRGSLAQVSVWLVGAASFMSANTLSAAKLGRDGWDVPSSGFYILAIANGIFYATLPTLAADTFDRQWLFTLCSGVFVMILAISLINTYPGFAAWLKALGWLACVPFSGLVVLTYLDRSDSPWVYPVMGTGFFLFQTLGSAWGIVMWRGTRDASPP
jgi:hypothetical protein